MEGMTDAESLATVLMQRRRDEVFLEYFREVSMETYEKWFFPYGRAKRPYLDREKHGGFVLSDPDATRHFYMLKRKYYSMRKKGRRFYPSRRDMSKATRMALRAMGRAAKTKTYKSKTEFGCDVIVSYEHPAAEYKGSYTAIVGRNGIYASEFKEKNGKMSMLDKAILEAIADWASKEGKMIEVTSKYED